MIHCPYCGTQLPDAARFCVACAKPQPVAAVVRPEPAVPVGTPNGANPRIQLAMLISGSEVGRAKVLHFGLVSGLAEGVEATVAVCCNELELRTVSSQTTPLGPGGQQQLQVPIKPATPGETLMDVYLTLRAGDGQVTHLKGQAPLWVRGSASPVNVTVDKRIVVAEGGRALGIDNTGDGEDTRAALVQALRDDSPAPHWFAEGNWGEVTLTLSPTPAPGLALRHVGSSTSGNGKLRLEPVDETAPRVFIVTGERLVLGKSRSLADLVCRHQRNELSNNISRRHAALVIARAGPTIEDLGSRNGTRINGAVIEHGNPSLLRHGDQITIYQLGFVFGEDRAQHRRWVRLEGGSDHGEPGLHLLIRSEATIGGAANDAIRQLGLPEAALSLCARGSSVVCRAGEHRGAVQVDGRTLGVGEEVVLRAGQQLTVANLSWTTR